MYWQCDSFLNSLTCTPSPYTQLQPHKHSSQQQTTLFNVRLSSLFHFVSRTRTFFHTRDLLYWMCKTHVRSRTRWVEPNDIYSIPFVVFKQAFVNMEANIGKISTSRIREYTSHDLANPNGQRQSNLMVGSNQKKPKRHVRNGNRRNWNVVSNKRACRWWYHTVY